MLDDQLAGLEIVGDNRGLSPRWTPTILPRALGVGDSDGALAAAVEARARGQPKRLRGRKNPGDQQAGLP